MAVIVPIAFALGCLLGYAIGTSPLRGNVARLPRRKPSLKVVR